MKALSHRSEVKKELRIAQMLRDHAEKNRQPEVARRYNAKVISLRNTLGGIMSWTERHDREY